MTQEIYRLLPLVAASIGFIGKTRENTVFNYRFRGVDDVLRALSQALLENNVSLTTRVSEHRVTILETVKDNKTSRTFHSTLLMEVAFHALDGSSLVNVGAGEGLDTNGDKATAKAQSAAFKQSITLSLCIPVDAKSIEDSDRTPRRGRESSGDGAPKNGKTAADYALLVRNMETAIDKAIGPKTLGRYRDQIPQQHFTADDQAKLLKRIESRLTESKAQQNIPLGEGNPV